MKKLIISIITISFVFGQNPVFQQFSTLFADIVEDVNQSVVTITAKKTYTMNKEVQDFYRFWGRNIPDSYQGRSLGSGVIVDADNGYVINIVLNDIVDVIGGTDILQPDCGHDHSI